MKQDEEIKFGYETRLTSDEIVKLIQAGRESGLTSLTVNGMKIKFGGVAKPVQQTIQIPQPSLETVEIPDVAAADLLKALSPLNEMSEDEIKFYATPYYDELQAEKEERAKQISEGTEL